MKAPMIAAALLFSALPALAQDNSDWHAQPSRDAYGSSANGHTARQPSCDGTDVSSVGVNPTTGHSSDSHHCWNSAVAPHTGGSAPVDAATRPGWQH